MPRTSPGAPAASSLPVALDDLLARSNMDDPALLRAATREAYDRVTLLLKACYQDFSPEQQARIRAIIGADAAPARTALPKRVKASRPPREDLPPRFWLPYSGETWTGRGRPPKAFIAWEGTVAHTEWKKHHPDERFPTYPG
ncbi:MULTISPECIES: H-NS family nucleoid-associated regulatory protein [unclassified Stenotrophomonas]|uniref:H-NS family nucleoid-associated regulatory protein n=1 Tax=unclassified Stenotrophomonas TaxID=196198 RepID=UPI002742900D|nr:MULTISPECIES: H-NS family nucleoid-associated regulatory protein [unclassified Stenotrophomonas]